MSDQQNKPQKETTSSGDAWEDVGKQFETLGESLAKAFRAAWNSEENQQRLQEMRSGLESIARNVDQAMQDTAASPEGQKIKTEANRAAESLRVATEQTAEEIRPRLVKALRQVNDELQKIIDRMEK
ncbi:MAG TPA: hypothetical protein VMT46_01530 [Anaerolineaceae bacterium]|nr:hypothetical protein [Anaerolineaceae bacterium]